MGFLIFESYYEVDKFLNTFKGDIAV